MRRRVPFVNNEVYIIPHFLCVGRVSKNFIIIQGAIIFILWKLFYYDKSCICSKNLYFVLLTISCTVSHTFIDFFKPGVIHGLEVQFFTLVDFMGHVDYLSD